MTHTRRGSTIVPGHDRGRGGARDRPARGPALPGEDVALEEALCRVLAGTSPPTPTCPPSTARPWTATRCGPGTWPGAGGARGHRRGAGGAVARPRGRPGPGGAHHDRGAGLPGADAVQQVEKTQPLDEFRVTILRRSQRARRGAPRLRGPGGGRRPRARPGDRPGGDRGARLRRTSPRARRAAAVVALLVTGDEIVEVAATPGPGQIRNSNGPAVAAQARLAGAEVRLLGVAPDRQDAIAEALRAGARRPTCSSSPAASRPATTTSSSRPSSSSGATFLFTKVAVKPGAPLVFGRRGGTLVFGLPGNPVSAQVTFDLFVRPALLKMQGASVVSRPRVGVELWPRSRTARAGRATFPPGCASRAAGSWPGRCAPWARATSSPTPAPTRSW